MKLDGEKMEFQFDEYVEAMHWFGWKKEKATEILNREIEDGNPMPDNLVRIWKRNGGLQDIVLKAT